ncbi:putative polysaccharide biosynthesis protein [Alicyclobacillus tolerans]|uniref:Polysaccharide transporter, PST family n=2 Tax=Alicyclobacillus tolerans TaxID=90970 RepID=A0A1M6PKF1_9BACL|nr:MULTISPECIES: polysaccharide biosynthesis protein [Alicyclobacillus]MDP9729288.1 PST family polysaccharide transporter [Alicyclobacillus tengchongensis]QRF22323.1 polysaccharide biosynthesis protein [Alicyclobacillus sp. TC]SHK08398.1 polysaccharide transporter, PST family [Alicyclobacillus montanus]
MDPTKATNVARGASIYVICVGIAKFLGIIYIIPLTYLLGNVGLGLYNNAYAMFTIFQQLALAGFPLAMSKLISERLAIKRYGEAEQYYRVAMRTIIPLGIIAFLLMWFLAPALSGLTAVQDSGEAARYMVPSFRALAFALLFIPFMSGYRGYLQGFQQLEMPAYSQTVEQIFRVLWMVTATYYLMRVRHESYVFGSASATFGATVGAAAGALLLALAVRPIRREYKPLASFSNQSDWQALRTLYKVALPISLGGLVVPISNLADSFTVQNLLIAAHDSFREAAAQYGILTRQALYLIQLPLTFAYAIGVSILPAVSSAKAKKDQSALQRTVSSTVRGMFLMTFPAAAVLLVLARPLSATLSGDFDGAPIISAVSFMAIFSSLELISTYILQGLGNFYRPVRNMFLGVFVKIMFNILLIPTFHSVMGAAIATTIGYIFSSTLNVLAVKKYGQVKFSLFRYSIRFLLPTLPTAAVLWITRAVTHWFLHDLMIRSVRITSAVELLLAVGAGGWVYIYLLLKLGIVREKELEALPGIGRRLAIIARRMYPEHASAR